MPWTVPRPPVPRRTYVRTPATAPGPAGPEMARSFGEIRRDPLAFCARMWRTYGDVVQFPIPRPPSYLVSAPESVRDVLVRHSRDYGKATIQYSALSLVTGEGLLTADTASWRLQRPLVQPAFHHSAVERVADHVGRSIERVRTEWSRAGTAPIDADDAMMRLSLEVVGASLFGSDLSADADRLATATLRALDVVVARARVPLSPPSWLPTPGNRRLRSAVRELDGAVRTMVAGRQRTGRPATDQPDMLDLLLAGSEGHGALTAHQVRDQVVTFIVAGHETVASALSWSFALLSRHPRIADDVADEARGVLGGRTPTFADYARLPLARAVFEETMRLYPPAWLITRKAHAAATLDDREIPAGALIITSPWIVHRHPGAWTDPEKFDPTRFLGERVQREAYLPFGAGPRMCIGRDFSYLEAVLVLAGLSQHFRFAPIGPLPEAMPQVTIRPRGGVRLTVTPRTPSP